MAKTAYFDCSSGISGDMAVAAFLDAGLPLAAIEKGAAKLKLKGYKLSARKVKRSGISGTKFDCLISRASGHRHRGFKDIARLIERSGLNSRVKDLAVDIFKIMARAEASVHGIRVQSVKFHEIGAVDSIIDVVGVSIAIDKFDIGEVYASCVNTGCGTVNSRHGILPVPAPAAIELLKGIPVRLGGPERELVTPTGAAILKALVKKFGDCPAMKVSEIGYGAGSGEIPGMPNMLRVMIGRTGDGLIRDRAVVIECNIDDATGQILGYTLERLMASGALDAYITPIQMKKSRPAFKLSVICETRTAQRMQEIIFQETSTLGLRRYETERVKLERKIVSVRTRFGNVRIKTGFAGARIKTIAPEYEDCAKIAASRALPLSMVMREASAAYKEKRR